MSLIYHRHISAIADADIKYLKIKDAQYEASWKRREGQGAFFTIVRPWDRLDAICKRNGYDLFSIIEREGLEGPDGSVIACVRDLRRYLLLVEAEMMERAESQKPLETTVRTEVRGMPLPKTITAKGPFLYSADGITDESERLVEYKYIGMLWQDIMYYVLDRKTLSAEDRDNLPLLQCEMNGKEFEMSPAYYKPMYEHFRSSNKWIILPEFREHWGKNP